MSDGSAGREGREIKLVVEWTAATAGALTVKEGVLAAGGVSSGSGGYRRFSIGSKESSNKDSGNKNNTNNNNSNRALYVSAERAYIETMLGIERCTEGNSTLSDKEKEVREERDWLFSIWKELLNSDENYICMQLNDVYTIYKRRYQLKYTALSVADIYGYTILYSLESETKCNDILTRLFEADLVSSLFYSVIGVKNLQLLRGLSNMYNRLMSLYLSSMTARWLRGNGTYMRILHNNTKMIFNLY